MVNNDIFIRHCNDNIKAITKELMALHYEIKVREARLKEFKEIKERLEWGNK